MVLYILTFMFLDIYIQFYLIVNRDVCFIVFWFNMFLLYEFICSPICNMRRYYYSFECSSVICLILHFIHTSLLKLYSVFKYNLI
jgi:hypothetical protein